VKLIVGLGNPGVQYQFTRHNIGFWVLETFAGHQAGTEIKWKRGFSSQILPFRLKDQDIILVKPQTYMNLSGRAVKEITDYYGIKTHQLLIIYDDIHLPFGRIRIRKKGSAGGHHGVESIIQYLQTEEFPRLRIGIRNDEVLLHHLDYSSFVLSRFLAKEEKMVEKVILHAVKAVEDSHENRV
jgi:PTH1 family peptidyl-tRNA hydrolase